MPVSKRVDQIILNHDIKINSDTSPDYMIEHLFQQALYTLTSQGSGRMVVFPFQKLKTLVRGLLFIWDVFYGMNYQIELNEYKILRNLKNTVRSHFLDLI